MALRYRCGVEGASALMALLCLVAEPACDPPAGRAVSGGQVSRSLPPSSASGAALAALTAPIPRDAAASSPAGAGPPGVSPLCTGAVPTRFDAIEAALKLSFDDAAMEGSDHGSFDAPTLSSPVSLTPARDAGAPTLSADVARVHVEYRWDLYHDRPRTKIEELRGRALERYSVHYTHGRAACEAELSRTQGPARTAREKPLVCETGQPGPSAEMPAYRVYGPLYVDAKSGDAFSISWFAKMPDWAVPSVDAAVRTRFLRDLAAAVTLAGTHDDLVRAAASPPPGAGVQVSGALNKEDFWLALAPPISALDLVRIWGLKDVVGVSSDVHMRSWHIAHRVGIGAWRNLETKTPHFGAWEVTASLDGRPSGGPVPNVRSGPIGHERIGPNDLVRTLSFAPHL